MPKITRTTGTKWERRNRGVAGFHTRPGKTSGHKSDKLILGVAVEVERKFRAWKARRGIKDTVDDLPFGKGFVYGQQSID